MIHYFDLLVVPLIALLSATPLISYPLLVQDIEVLSQSTPLRNLKIGETAYITANIQNSYSQVQNFSYITEVMDADGIVVYIKWYDGSLAEMQTSRLSNTWTPEQTGSYTIKVLVWSSINGSPIALAELKTTTLQIS